VKAHIHTVRHFQVAYADEGLVVQKRMIYLISVASLLLFVNDVFIRSKLKLIV